MWTSQIQQEIKHRSQRFSFPAHVVAGDRAPVGELPMGRPAIGLGGHFYIFTRIFWFWDVSLAVQFC